MPIPFLFNSSSGLQAALSSVGFFAPLKSSLDLAKGTGTATFARATTATVMGYAPNAVSGASQVLLSCAAGEARFSGARRVSAGVWAETLSDGTPIPEATLKGYLSEPAATNLLTYSNDLTNAAWVKTTLTVALTSTGPDGVINSASRVTAAAGNATALYTYIAADSMRTYSVWVKRITGTGNFDLTQDGVTFTTVATTAGWTQVQLTNSQLNAVVGFRIASNADAFDVWCNQFEAGAIATSPIPTTTVAVTRNADVLTYSSSGNILGTSGSSYIECIIPTNPFPIADFYLIGTSGSSATMQFMNAKLAMFDGTAYREYENIGETPSPNFRKYVNTWSNTTTIAAKDGTLLTAAVFDGDTGASTGPISIGGINGVYLFPVNIRNVRIWQVPLSDSILKGITT